MELARLNGRLYRVSHVPTVDFAELRSDFPLGIAYE